jgi:hypothetical protein
MVRPAARDPPRHSLFASPPPPPRLSHRSSRARPLATGSHPNRPQQSISWHEVAATGAAPCARSGHTLTAMPGARSRLLLFGGHGRGDGEEDRGGGESGHLSARAVPAHRDAKRRPPSTQNIYAQTASPRPLATCTSWTRRRPRPRPRAGRASRAAATLLPPPAPLRAPSTAPSRWTTGACSCWAAWTSARAWPTCGSGTASAGAR